MVQKSARSPSEPAARRRGRPRAFEPETALTQAMDVFWQEGFAATSLDSLSAATGLNRPSLYGAFGDKRALYLQAYSQYRKRVNETFAPLFQGRAPLRTKLRRIFVAALELYLSGEHGPRGCFTVLDCVLGRGRRPGGPRPCRRGDRRDRSRVRATVRGRARGGRIAARRQSARARATGRSDHPHALDPRPRPNPEGRDPADHRRRGGDDLRTAKRSLTRPSYCEARDRSDPYAARPRICAFEGQTVARKRYRSRDAMAEASTPTAKFVRCCASGACPSGTSLCSA